MYEIASKWATYRVESSKLCWFWLFLKFLIEGIFMQVGYVVLYVNDSQACIDFWTNQVGMRLVNQESVCEHIVAKVGFKDQDFAFELVPLEMMKDNPNNLDLATPSICFYVQDVESEHQKLKSNNVTCIDVNEHFGRKGFAFSDNEGRWFAVQQA